MALIIKGDMPTFCERLTEVGNNMEYCRFACVCESHNISTMAIPSDCLILGEIPDEHGDLIERSPLVQKIKDEWQKIHEETGYDVNGIFWNKLVEIIESSEVVLEAST